MLNPRKTNSKAAHQARVQFHSCQGSLYIDLTEDCAMERKVVRGDCEIEGADRFCFGWLLRGFARPLHFEVEAAGQGVLDDDLDRMGATGIALGDAPVARDTALFRHLVESGRAASRERVGQYVE